MIEEPEINDVEVDRREETLVTRHPGYTATEQVIRDVAAERRMGLFQLNRIMWSLLVFLRDIAGHPFYLENDCSQSEQWICHVHVRDHGDVSSDLSTG